MIYAMHQIQVACIVRHAGGSAWHRRLPAAASPTSSCCSPRRPRRPGVGGDVRSSICAVEQQDGRFTLAKEATVISYGAEADGILVTARRTPQSPASDQVIVVVPQDRLRARPGERAGTRSACAAPAATAIGSGPAARWRRSFRCPTPTSRRRPCCRSRTWCGARCGSASPPTRWRAPAPSCAREARKKPAARRRRLASRRGEQPAAAHEGRTSSAALRHYEAALGSERRHRRAWRSPSP